MTVLDFTILRRMAASDLGYVGKDGLAFTESQAAWVCLPDRSWPDGGRFFRKFDAIPNLSTDMHNHGLFSFDHIGANYD